MSTKENKKIFVMRVDQFFSETIWDKKFDNLPIYIRVFVELIRTLTFTVHKFVFDNSLIKASALTYYTLLSIVPLIAFFLAVGKGFGLEEMLEQQLRSNFISDKPGVGKIFEFSKNMIHHAKGGLFTGIGIGLLIWAIIKGLGKIEMSFNQVWEIKKPRTFARKFSDYLSVMVLMPILMIILGGINVFLSAGLKTLGTEYSILGLISPVVLKLLQTLPYFIIWLLLIFLYIFMPNTRVRFKSAFIAGLVAGTIYQLVQWTYIKFQIGVSTYSEIYGSLAALPLLLIWLQLSWSIVLWGAELSFYIQNRKKVSGLTERVNNSIMSERILAIAVLHKIVYQFKNGNPPMSVFQLSKFLNLKYSEVKRSQLQLLECGLISEISKMGRKVYQPAMDTKLITIAKVVNLLDQAGNNPEYDFPLMDYKFINEIKKRYSNLIEQEMGDTPLADIKKIA